MSSGGAVESLEELGRFVATFRWDTADQELREQLVKTLLDTLGVMIAGGQLPEVRALAAAWAPQDGPSRLFGFGRTAGTGAAAYLNGVSAVTLELDEGNKYARGHPASHAFPAALAVAQERNASGPELAAALVVGYETASRFGRATRLNSGVHPHGNWGVAGAAAAVSRLMGLGPDAVAAALDAAGGMALATPFESALVGNFVRNAWVGAANHSGLVAARMAAAGIAAVDGTPSATLGGILGAFDPDELTEDLGQRFDLENGYFKRHASCSYTHPPADAVLNILAENPGIRPEQVSSVLVETHEVAATLDLTVTPTRLAAMFSIPYVVAAAILERNCRPAVFDDEHREDPTTRRLMSATRVVATEEFDRRLPEERGARVTLTLRDGSSLVSEVPNPVGDVAYKPFGLAEIREKVDPLLEPAGIDAATLEGTVRGLLEAGNVNEALVDVP
ncbi:MAG: MmgE/PrpD family protein, partial [Rubrobacter sp.]